jgi:hypothetical protein
MTLIEQLINPGILLLGGIILVAFILAKVLEHTTPIDKK